MVPFSMAGLIKIGLKSLRVMSKVKVFTTQDGQKAGPPAEHDWLPGT